MSYQLAKKSVISGAYDLNELPNGREIRGFGRLCPQ